MVGVCTLVKKAADGSCEDVRIGLPVQVVFEQHDDVWFPLFEPAL